MFLAAVTAVISLLIRGDTIHSVFAKMEDTKVKTASSMGANKTEETSYVGKASSPSPSPTSATTNEKITSPPTSSPSPINMTLNQTALKMNIPTQIPQVDAHDDNASDYDIKALPNTLEIAPSRRYHVFQISGTGVASTMTVNLLTGLFEGKDQGMAYLECKRVQKKENCNWLQGYSSINGRKHLHHLNMTIVTKTHVQNADLLQSWFREDFDNIFFVGNERMDTGKFLPPEYCANDTYPNILCLEYDDLQYNDIVGLRKVVKYVKDRIYSSFPYFANVQLKEEEAVQRLLEMTESYKGTPGYNIKRYGVGGGKARNHTLGGDQ
jgi:hypothetical protein